MTHSTLSQAADGRSSNGSNGRALPGVPAARLTTEELTEECRRRGLIVLDGAAPRVLPGLVLQPGGQLVVWRGREYVFHPIEGRVLHVLAGLWPRPIPGPALTRMVWGPHANQNGSRVYVRAIRARAPGLIETVSAWAGYRLNLRGEA